MRHPLHYNYQFTQTCWGKQPYETLYLQLGWLESFVLLFHDCALGITSTAGEVQLFLAF